MSALGQSRLIVTAPAVAACPLRSSKRTCGAQLDMSVKCHVWTAPSWQGFSSRLQAGRCSHVFGLLARHTRPLAIMPSADQVPVKSPHSTMQWHMWVVLIAGSTGSALRAVRPPNLHITPNVGAISVTPQVRRVPCSDHLWPAWPTPFLRSCWQVRSRPPWWAAAPTMP
jgi:hypothetical protein